MCDVVSSSSLIWTAGSVSNIEELGPDTIEFVMLYHGTKSESAGGRAAACRNSSGRWFKTDITPETALGMMPPGIKVRLELHRTRNSWQAWSDSPLEDGPRSCHRTGPGALHKVVGWVWNRYSKLASDGGSPTSSEH